VSAIPGEVEATRRELIGVVEAARKDLTAQVESAAQDVVRARPSGSRRRLRTDALTEAAEIRKMADRPPWRYLGRRRRCGPGYRWKRCGGI